MQHHYGEVIAVLLPLDAHYPLPGGVLRQIGDASHVELLHHVLTVGLYGLDTHVEERCNLSGGHPLGQ